ncbi:MAG: type I-E CRISPR-associated protein Cas5/CasD [bacterium]
MSSDVQFLALRLQGPLQSWGFESQYSRRGTGLMPTKSAVAGICCAALGYARGSGEEKEFLSGFSSVRMIAIAIPRRGSDRELAVRRLQDYHTVQNTRTAEGKLKDCHITHRHYLTDASFGVLLEGAASLLRQIYCAMKNPRWGIWLGRKTCLPSAPVLAGLKESRDEAIRLLVGEMPVELFTRQIEVEDFAHGRDSLPDAPMSFATGRRSFSPRRVRTIQRS